MKKILLWLLGLGGAVVLLLVAAVLLVPKFIDVESYLPEIEKKVTEATGRSFTIGPDFNVSVFPWAGVSFTDLQLGNPDSFGGGDFVKVKAFEVRVKIMPLLSKQIEIDKFIVDGPEILLVKNEDGTGNWSFGDGAANTTADPPAAAEKSPAPAQDGAGSSTLPITSLQVGEFSVTNGVIVYHDKGLNQKKSVEGITLQLTDVSLERPIGLFFQAEVDGKPMDIKGSVGPVGKQPGKGTVNIDLAINAVNQLALKLKGSVVEPIEQQRFTMMMDIASFSPRRLLEELGITFPIQTTDPGVLDKVAVKLNISGDPTAISIKDSSIILDDSTLKLSADLKEMEKPDMAFVLDLDAINVDRYLPPPAEKDSGTPGPAPAGKTEETTPAPAAEEPAAIDYTPLRKLVLNGEVKVGELIASGAKVQDILIKIVGKGGVFDLDPFQLKLYQGGLDVVGKFDFQQDNPKIAVDLNSENIQVGPLLKESVNKEILEGNMNAKAGISFVGDDVDEIKKTLNGQGELKFIDGAIVGVDIAGMVRDFKAGAGLQKQAEKPRTDFAELKVPFTLTNGLFQTDATSLQSPLLRLLANGSADLVSEKLDMKVKPKIVGTIKGQGDTEDRAGLSIPIHVGGTFKKPKYSADLSGLASKETIKEVLKDPSTAKEKVKEVEEAGKGLLKSFGFGN